MKKTSKAILAVGLVLAVILSKETLAAENQSTMAIAPSIGYTSFSIKGDNSTGFKGGYSVGALGYLNTGVDNLDYEVGLEYLQAGGSDNYLLAKVDYSLDYLAVPLGIRWKAFRYGAQSEKFFFIRAGLAPSYLLSAKAEASSIFGASQSISLDTNSFDLIAYLGIGGSYDVGNNQEILYDLRYLQGTQDVMKASASKNIGLTASVMYSISL